MISFQAFLIGTIVVLLIARGAVELYIYYSEQKKSPSDAPTSDRQLASISQQAIQRYYNKNIKGA